MVEEIEQFTVSLISLIKEIKANEAALVSRKALRRKSLDIAKTWLKFSNPLRSNPAIVGDLVITIDANFQRILELSSGNNSKKTYLRILKPLPKIIQRDILVPLIKASGTTALPSEVTEKKILGQVKSNDEMEFFAEAFKAAKAQCFKAAIVMTWCAAIDRLRSFVLQKGLTAFNATSTALKANQSGVYKRFNKEFTLNLEIDLQEVSDKDLITVISGMSNLDMNELKEMFNLLDTRTGCAHPSDIVVEDMNYAHFIHQVYNLILVNPKLA